MSAAGQDLGAVLRADMEAIGLDVEGQGAFITRVLELAALLTKWNARIRLVGPSSEEAIVREQIVDALGFVLAIDALDSVDAWWDVGAGGGLPGILLALRFPRKRFVLVEPIHKKTAFLHEAVRALGLGNVVVHTGRVDVDGSLSPPLPRDVYTPRAALSRATLAPEVWLQTARALVGRDGLVLVALADTVPDAIANDPTSSPMGTWRWRVPVTRAPRTLVARRIGAPLPPPRGR